MCTLGGLCCVFGVLGHLAPDHRCARLVCRFECAVSWATWLLFTSAHNGRLVLRVRCRGPLCSYSPARTLGLLSSVRGVLGHLAPVHRCARSLCCAVCAVLWATRLLFTGVHARCVVLRVRCPWPLRSCSPVHTLSVLCCACGVLRHLAPVDRCARFVCCVAWAVSWTNWLLFTGPHARCVVLRVRCPEALGSCSPVCTLGMLCCVCRALRDLAPVQRCARSVSCVACTVSWSTWLRITGVHARCVVLSVRCPPATWLLFNRAHNGRPVLRVRCRGPLCSYSLARTHGVLCFVRGVLGHLAPVHRYAGAVCCAVFAVSCVLGHLAPVHRCVHLVCCVACAVSWATWLSFSGVHVSFAVLRVHSSWPPGPRPPVCTIGVLCLHCPGPCGSGSPVCPLDVLCRACGVSGHLAPVHWCARSVCCGPCVVSWATWLLFTGVHAPWFVLRVQCPGPLGSCSPVSTLVCCVACAVFWATWLLFNGAHARCVVPRVRSPGILGSCPPVCMLGVLCCVRVVLGQLGSCLLVCTLGVLCFARGVLGHLAPVHRCACSVLFVLCVRCPRPVGSCSPMCTLGVLCCVFGVLGHLPELPPTGGGMWPYPRTHVGTPSHPGHVDQLAATLPSQAPAGAA